MSEMIQAQTASNTISTFKNNEEDKKTIFNATSNSSSLNEHMGEIITLKGVFLTPGVRRGYDGGPDIACTNTYIVDVEGNSYFSQASGVARDIANLIGLFGDNIEGTKIRVGEREIGGGRRIKYVEIV